MTKTLALLIFQLTALSLVSADSILLNSHEALTGELVEIQAGFVILRLPESEGEALRRISPDTIKALHFDDSDTPLEKQALKRAKFQPILSEKDSRILIELLTQYLEQDNPLPALAYARSWHSKSNYPSLDASYRNLLIKSAAAADLPGEALVHAETWLAHSPPPYSEPLPWQILAQRQLDSGETEAALWTALTPIAHTTAANREALAPLQTIAAYAYRELGFVEHARAYTSADELPAPDAKLILHSSPHLSQRLKNSLQK